MKQSDQLFAPAALGHHSRSGRFGEQIYLTPAGNRTTFSSTSSHLLYIARLKFLT